MHNRELAEFHRVQVNHDWRIAQEAFRALYPLIDLGNPLDDRRFRCKHDRPIRPTDKPRSRSLPSINNGGHDHFLASGDLRTTKTNLIAFCGDEMHTLAMPVRLFKSKSRLAFEVPFYHSPISQHRCCELLCERLRLWTWQLCRVGTETICLRYLTNSMFALRHGGHSSARP